MEFTIGQSVIHPAHGVGEIVDIEEKELVEGFRCYYVLAFTRNRLTVHVPVRRVADIGVRSVMSACHISAVIQTLEVLPIDLPDEFRLRRTIINEQIHSGYPKQIAAAVRDLTWRRTAKYLTEADQEALEEARTLLITEMSLALEQECEQAGATVDAALKRAILARQIAEREDADSHPNETGSRDPHLCGETEEVTEPLSDWSLQPAI